MQNFCEQCGEKLEVGEKFCSNCGVPIERDELPPPVSVNPMPSKATTSSEKKDSHTMIVGLLIIAVAIAAVFWHFKVANNYSMNGISLGMSKSEIEKKFQIGEFLGRDCYRVNGICVGFHYKFAGDDNPQVGYLYSSGDYNADLKGVKIGSSVSDIKKAFGYNYSLYQNNYTYSIEDADIFFYVDEYSGRVSNFGVYYNDRHTY